MISVNLIFAFLDGIVMSTKYYFSYQPLIRKTKVNFDYLTKKLQHMFPASAFTSTFACTYQVVENNLCSSQKCTFQLTMQLMNRQFKSEFRRECITVERRRNFVS